VYSICFFVEFAYDDDADNPKLVSLDDELEELLNNYRSVGIHLARQWQF